MPEKEPVQGSQLVRWHNNRSPPQGAALLPGAATSSSAMNNELMSTEDCSARLICIETTWAAGARPPRHKWFVWSRAIKLQEEQEVQATSGASNMELNGDQDVTAGLFQSFYLLSYGCRHDSILQQVQEDSSPQIVLIELLKLV